MLLMLPVALTLFLLRPPETIRIALLAVIVGGSGTPGHK